MTYLNMFRIPSKTRMVVFDMMGTIIKDGGIAYNTLYKTIKDFGLNTKPNDKENWYGLDSLYVVDKILTLENKYIKEIDFPPRERIYNDFINNLREQYNKDENLYIEDDTFNLFDELRKNNIKVALNTGLPKPIQRDIIYNNGLDKHIDDYIGGDDVFRGRPYPFMIFTLAGWHTISPHQIVKVGDTRNDMFEGQHAGCSHTVGVLSGVDNRKTLLSAGATDIIDSILDIKI
tara:strand:- start:112 stop:807 length:696 start_codon:yes stop_codon:yes gene_type:complete